MSDRNTVFDEKREYSVDDDRYRVMYQASISDPQTFWADHAKRIDWHRFPTKIKNTSYVPGDVSIKWFEDGQLNISENCIDRHLAKRANDTAIIWEGDTPDIDKHISFQMLHDEVCQLANGLKKLGVTKGDRVAIYMPMVPEAAYAMLAHVLVRCTQLFLVGFHPTR
jgi:acetyl-CoA synthetase